MTDYLIVRLIDLFLRIRRYVWYCQNEQSNIKNAPYQELTHFIKRLTWFIKLSHHKALLKIILRFALMLKVANTLFFRKISFLAQIPPILLQL